MPPIALLIPIISEGSSDLSVCTLLAAQKQGQEKLSRARSAKFTLDSFDRFIGKVKKYLDLDELTPAALNDMVKAVYVHVPDNSSGHREQNGVSHAVSPGLSRRGLRKRHGAAQSRCAVTPFAR